MKNHIILLAFLVSFNSFSQSKDTIYFLINKKDPLIKKIENKEGSSNHYQIFFDKKKRIKKNNTPWPKDSLNSGTIKVWVADTKYDYYVYERESYEFNFYGINDKLIYNSFLDSLNLITCRKHFLKMKNLFHSTLFFIELINNDNYIMREVYVASYE